MVFGCFQPTKPPGTRSNLTPFFVITGRVSPVRSPLTMWDFFLISLQKLSFKPFNTKGGVFNYYYFSLSGVLASWQPLFFFGGGGHFWYLIIRLVFDLNFFFLPMVVSGFHVNQIIFSIFFHRALVT